MGVRGMKKQKIEKIAIEAKVGIFVLLGLIILFYLSFQLGGLGTELKGGYKLYSLFDSAIGLDPGADVDIAGVKVGKVDSINLEGGKARVTMTIRKGVKVGQDASAMIRTHGLMGDKFVSLNPGTPGRAALSPGGKIAKTISGVDLDKLMSDLGEVAGDLKSVIGTFQKAFGGERGAKSVRSILTNFEQLSANLNKVVTENSSRISGIVKNFEEFSGKLGRIDKKANTLLDNLVSVSESLKEGKGTLGKLIVSDELYNQLKGAVGSMQAMSEKINSSKGTLGKLINDPALYDDAKETLNNLKVITAKIRAGKGTLGKLVNDDKLYEEAEKTLKKVQKGAEGLEEQTPIAVLSSVFGIFF